MSEITGNENERNVHISRNALVWTWLAHFCTKGTPRRDLFVLMRHIYWDLFGWVVAAEFPKAELVSNTNMDATLRGLGIKTEVPVTIVDVIRAGMRPSAICHEILLESGVIDESLVHEHHITAARIAGEHGEVVGVEVDYAKADEPVRPGSIVIFPDPMLATGTTLCEIISRYKERFPGCVTKFVVVNMIATPFGVKKIHSVHPEVVIYAGRMDQELTDKGYIVPGAGGVGELLTGTKK